jgi:PAS domain-containing protein
VLRLLAEQELPDAVRRLVGEGRISGALVDNRRVLDATDGYLETIGCTREELEAGTISWLLLTPGEWLAADARAIGELRMHGVATPYEKEYVRPDGTTVRVRILAIRVELEPLRVLALVAHADDEEACEALDTVAPA